MKSISGLARCAFGASAATVLFAGCSGGSSALPPAPVAAPAATVAKPLSPIVPDAKSGALLYVADALGGGVSVYTWPKLKPHRGLGTSGATDELCSDTKGDVYVPVPGQRMIFEYAHGGTKPIKTLADYFGTPSGCAVDPMTGDLAVLNSYDSANVVVYSPDPSLSPVSHGLYIGTYAMVAYDNEGNLFVDGQADSSSTTLWELPAGATFFEPVTIDQSISFPGGMMWDGKYLAVGDEATDTIYQFAISGANATVEGSTSLAETVKVYQFWVTGIKKGLQGAQIVAADFGSNAVDVFKYPAGGNPTAQITGFQDPQGLTISQTSKEQ